MKFVNNKVAFGRHQTFAVRYGWLSKGFQAVKSNPDILRKDDAVAELGVGKNMVESIGYWLRAFQLVEPNSFKVTQLGTDLFSRNKGYDPYLEDEATIWLLHWLLVSNPEQATAWYWFFNRYHKPEFTAQEIQTALSDFVNDQVKDIKRPAVSTLKSDASLIPRMYTQSKLHKHMPIEEALDSPLAMLRLVTQMVGERGFQSKPGPRPGLPIGVIGYAITQLFAAKGTDIIPIEDLMYSRDEFPAIGAVFRLTEVDLLTKLEKLTEYIPAVFQINETAGIHQLYLMKTIDPMEYLHMHYSCSKQGEAA
ncbi:DUF4007 family protein [Pseudohalioglobus lutimaris]|uniref:DUF4007 domain-containing protein n=1 Tax=Pseudohalioglobus lutimaris TaxID=1737061 RepID=A0A2N5WXG5_9GAMM|nr:DUF4007 family protein [Pseudohalioglobus lutimaris]PLW66918.1 DUF4007 domain-containing protein [Pseudohalioglobus lutimaris]